MQVIVMQGKKHQWREFWKEYRWPNIGVFWVVALGLGYWGFQEQNFLTKANRTTIDNLYLAFMLFTFNTIEGEGVGWALQIARWLAPIVAFCAALQGAAVIFKDEIQDYYISRLQNHVVICGLGEKGLRLAEKFKEKDNKGVIVIEKDESNPAITDCREKGSFVLVGDAAKITSLKKARVRHARYLLEKTAISILVSLCMSLFFRFVITKTSVSLSKNQIALNSILVLVILSSICVSISAALTLWPMRWSFHGCKAKMEILANQVNSEAIPKMPVQAGPFLIVDGYIDANQQVNLWLATVKRSECRQFVYAPYSEVKALHLAHVIDLGSGWCFVE